MSKNTFPNHTGGVVQVRHTIRYGAVPESLLEDRRLDLDSRAVAAWLAVKQDGWQILIVVLRKRLARANHELLGKDRWQRIANELESAGYLTRTKVNGKDGRWNWHITFTPVPDNQTGAGFAGSGAASSGMASAGLAERGQPGHKVIPRRVVPNKETTITNKSRLVDAVVQECCSTLFKPNDIQELHYPMVNEKELQEVKKIILFCNIEDRQGVLDEIEGIRRAGDIKRGVIPLTKALVGKVATGEFSLSVGHSIQAQREKQAIHEFARSTSMALVGPLLSMSEADIAKLPPNIAKRIREQSIKADRSDNLGRIFNDDIL